MSAVRIEEPTPVRAKLLNADLRSYRSHGNNLRLTTQRLRYRIVMKILDNTLPSKSYSQKNG